MSVIDTQQQLEAIQYRAKQRDELGYAPNDIDFLLTLLDQTDTRIKELEQRVAQQAMKIATLETYKVPKLQSRIEAALKLADEWEEYPDLAGNRPDCAKQLREALGGSDANN